MRPPKGTPPALERLRGRLQAEPQLALTQAQWAAALGVSRRHVGKLMACLRCEGLVECVSVYRRRAG